MGDFEQNLFNVLVAAGFVIAPAVFFVLLFVPAPYGRHTRSGWGPNISRRLGWVIMELPSAAAFAFFFLLARPAFGPAWIFLGLWLLHYVYRSLVYPFRLRATGRTNPVFIILSAIAFNIFNGYVNGRYLGVNAGDYSNSWLGDPRFLVGIALFALGAGINLHSDEILLRLRKRDESEYTVPTGGLYRFVSSPNYLGELIEWCGWAVLTWSLPGLLFAVWTAANLLPRARTHHKWYHERFPDYPPERKAVVPFIF